MKATLWRMRNRPETDDVDPDTGDVTGTSPATDAELLGMGMKIVGVAPNGDEIVHVAPGVDVPNPPDFTIIFNPGWSWDDVPSQVRDNVLEAAYETEETVDGETVTVRRRGKVADVPSGATVVETDLPPHRWYGDE